MPERKEMTAEEVLAHHPDKIVLSPGPGRPENAGILLELIRLNEGRIPMLGVCLGHQALCAAYGATVTYAKRLMHGKQSRVTFDTACPLFYDMEPVGLVARYHSLAADPSTLPDCLTITAQTDEGEIMAVQHRQYPLFGVQFHPESIMTPNGDKMLHNFIKEAFV